MEDSPEECRQCPAGRFRKYLNKSEELISRACAKWAVCRHQAHCDAREEVKDTKDFSSTRSVFGRQCCAMR